MKNVLHYIPLAITMLLSSCGKEFRRRKVKYTISSDRHKPAFLFFSCRELGKAAYLNNNTQPLSNYTMKTIYYVLLLLVLASCNNKSQDTGILNGEIICIEEHAPEKEVEFKELTLKGLNFGNLAIHDSLAFFMNPKLQSKWFQLFNCHTLDEVGEFVGKGNGHEEFIAVGPIWNFYTENNELKTLIFDGNKESVSVWNITKSLAGKSTIIEKEIKMPWKKENRGACFNELLIKDSCTLYAKVSANPTNDHDASLPYYQIRDLRNGKKISDIQIFKKSIVNKQTKFLPQTFFYSHDAMKPDGSKIAQAMLHVPQLNIIDTKSKAVTGYRMNENMSLSDLETSKELKPYFIRICADDNYIYTVFYGKAAWKVNEVPCVNQIYIFDWEGHLVRKTITKHCIDEIAVDGINKILYTTSPMDEKLYYIKTDELITGATL